MCHTENLTNLNTVFVFFFWMLPKNGPKYCIKKHLFCLCPGGKFYLSLWSHKWRETQIKTANLFHWVKNKFGHFGGLKHVLTLIRAAKGPKGLSCFEKQTAKHFLKWKKFKNLGIPGKLYVDYFQFNINLIKCLFLYAFQHFVYLSKKWEPKLGS